MNDQDSQRRVVIIGGGFAGLFAARMLRRAPVRVTLIDRRPHHLFQPLLYQCSTGILSEGKIAVPLRDLLRKQKNADFVLQRIKGIRPAQGFEEVLLPGEPEARSAKARLKDGIPVADTTWEQIVEGGKSVGVDVEAIVPA